MKKSQLAVALALTLAATGAIADEIRAGDVVLLKLHVTDCGESASVLDYAEVRPSGEVSVLERTALFRPLTLSGETLTTERIAAMISDKAVPRDGVHLRRVEVMPASGENLIALKNELVTMYVSEHVRPCARAPIRDYPPLAPERHAGTAPRPGRT